MVKSTHQHLVVLGGTSAVAIAYARKKIADGGLSITLVGRNLDTLSIVADDLTARGATKVNIVAKPIGDLSKLTHIFDAVVSSDERIDEVCLAYSALGDQQDLQGDMSKLRDLLELNYVSSVMWMELFADYFEQQKAGQLTVIGSVAGDRGRQSNYLYGSTKAGLERVAEGMAHRFANQKSITVTLVKPGFIDTPMTAHIENKGGPLWASPDKIADIIDKAVKQKRVRVYAPWFWRYILLVIRAVPIFVMHKTQL